MSNTKDAKPAEEGNPEPKEENGLKVWLEPLSVTITMSDEFNHYNPETEESTLFWRRLSMTCNIKTNGQPLEEGESEDVYIREVVLDSAALIQELINQMAQKKKQELAPVVEEVPI